MFSTCFETHACECWPTVPTNHLSLRAEILSAPAHLSHMQGCWGPNGNLKKSFESDLFIYTKLWYRRNVLHVLPDNVLGTEIVPIKLAVQILVLFVVGGFIFCTKLEKT